MNTYLSKFSGRINPVVGLTLSVLSVGLVGCDGSFNIPPTAVIVDTVNSQSGNVISIYPNPATRTDPF